METDATREMWLQENRREVIRDGASYGEQAGSVETLELLASHNCDVSPSRVCPCVASWYRCSGGPGRKLPRFLGAEGFVNWRQEGARQMS